MLPQLNPTRIPRVFMTADAVGTWRYAVDLAQGLRAYDTATTLCILGPPPSPEQRASARRIPNLELVCLEAPLDWAAESLEQVLDAARQVIAAARDNRPTVVHLNSPALAAVSGYPAPVVVMCHSCPATWWHVVRAEPLPRTSRWHKGLVGEGLRRAAAVIAPTAAFARSLDEVYGLERSATVIYNGRRPSVRSTVQKPHIPEASFAFSTGRLDDEGQNFPILDAVAARLATPIYVSGWLDRSGASRFEHLRLLGPLAEPEIAEWLSAKPIFVSAALYVPFGRAVLEAAEAACPLVLSDVPSFRELWQGAARFVSRSDPSAFAAAIDELARDAQARTLLGAAARRRARRYTAEVMAAKVQGVYGGLLAEKPARSGREAVL